MNAAKTLKLGDIVFFDYGCMIGSDFGTVMGVEETAFGAHVWVRKSDFSMTPVTTLNGTVTGKIVQDCNGEEFFSARGVKGIGSYLVKN